MMSTGGLCASCLLVVAIITTTIVPATDGASKASIALIFIWYASFGVQSPVVWIITTESAPTTNREKVLAVATFLGFGISLLIASVSPYLQNEGYGDLGSRIVSRRKKRQTADIARASSGAHSPSSLLPGSGSLCLR